VIRLHLSYHSDYEDAARARETYLRQHPESATQVRKRKANFELVKRIEGSKSENVSDTPRKRRVKRKWRSPLTNS
jgi:hypothetical protein